MIGGSYGYARCTLGPLFGFLVGYSEIIEYVLYVSSSVLELGSIITFITNGNPAYEPLYWLGFYVIALAIHIKHGNLFWRFNMTIGAIAFILIIIYFLASLPSVDIEKYVIRESSPFFAAGISKFLYYLPLASWFYVGIEILTLSCEEVTEVKIFESPVIFL